MELLQGDCLKLMEGIPSGSIDLILCDLPYGMTDCKWDAVIPFDKLWRQYRRVIKPKGNCVLFGNQPFTSAMIQSNLREYSHMWYWRKNAPTGHLLAKKQPLRVVEDIVVFILRKDDNSGSFQALRDYMDEELKKTGLTKKQISRLLGNSMHSHYWTRGQQFTLPSRRDYALLQSTGHFQRPLEELKAEWKAESGQRNGAGATYNPQGVKDCHIVHHETGKSNIWKPITPKTHIQKKTGYPRNLLEYSKEPKPMHPTQKPVELLEYLVKTYSNEGETVLDNCMGSGSTGVACMNTGRRFIGMEKEKEYFELAKQRIENAAFCVR